MSEKTLHTYKGRDHSFLSIQGASQGYQAENTHHRIELAMGGGGNEKIPLLRDHPEESDGGKRHIQRRTGEHHFYTSS